MGKGEIWVCEAAAGAPGQFRKAFEEAGLLNPVRVLKDDSDLRSLLQADGGLPLVLLVDLAHPRAWDILNAVRDTQLDHRVAVMALVDPTTECLLDRAYEEGVKTYLRKPLTFVEFVRRAKMLNMNLLLGRPQQ